MALNVFRPVHTRSDFATTLSTAKEQINQLDFSPNAIRVGSAHVMGGCAMGANESEGVVDSHGAVIPLKQLIHHGWLHIPHQYWSQPTIIGLWYGSKTSHRARKSPNMM